MGTLYLVATPIGNRSDITLRAARTLLEVELVLCEDTRHTGLLLDWIRNSGEFSQLPQQNRPELLSYNDYNREKRLPAISERLIRGERIALVSNAGTPLLSDPDFKLVEMVIALSKQYDVRLESLPGANAVLPALQLSGLPPDRFLFLGFLPKSSGKLQQLLERLSKIEELDLVKTFIAFESPYRLQKSLAAIQAKMPNASVAVCRELTKLHEEIFRGSVGEATAYFNSQRIRGEITLVFSRPWPAPRSSE